MRVFVAIASVALLACAAKGQMRPGPSVRTVEATPGRIEGTVVHAIDRSPARSAAVFAYGSAADGKPAPMAMTDSAGRFSFDSLRTPAEYDFVARLGGDVGITETSVLARGEHWSGVEIEIFPGSTLRGDVRTIEGRPMVEADVFLARNGEFRWAVDARTNADGSFVAEGLFPGSYSIGVRSGPSVSVFQKLDVVANASASLTGSTARDRTTPPGMIAGVVIDEAGNAVRDFEVWIARADGKNTLLPGRVVHSIDGAFAFRSRAAGNYEARVRTASGLVGSKEFRMKEGSRATGIRVRVGKGVRLRGRVQMLREQRASTSIIEVCGHEPHDCRRGTLGADGAFEFAGLLPLRKVAVAIVTSDGVAKVWDVQLKRRDVDLGTLHISKEAAP